MQTKGDYIAWLKAKKNNGEITIEEYNKRKERAEYQYYYDLAKMYNLRVQYPEESDIKEAIFTKLPLATKVEHIEVLIKSIDIVAGDPDIIAIPEDFIENIAVELKKSEETMKKIFYGIIEDVTCKQYPKNGVVPFIFDIMELLDEQLPCEKSAVVTEIEQQIANQI